MQHHDHPGQGLVHLLARSESTRIQTEDSKLRTQNQCTLKISLSNNRYPKPLTKNPNKRLAWGYNAPKSLFEYNQ